MTPKQELKKIQTDLGITNVKLAEILEVKTNTMNKMFSEKAENHNIRDFHVKKVKIFLKNYIKNLHGTF